MKELSLLKTELEQQIDASKKDLELLLAALARHLAPLPPAEAAEVLNGLDDESTILVLRQFSTSRRQKILSHFDPRRARRIRSALRSSSR